MSQDPRRICQHLIQHRWINPAQAQKALRAYQAASGSVPFPRVLLKLQFISADQYKILLQKLSPKEAGETQISQKATTGENQTIRPSPPTSMTDPRHLSPPQTLQDTDRNDDPLGVGEGNSLSGESLKKVFETQSPENRLTSVPEDDPSLPHTSLKGGSFSKYRIEKKLGEGGMGDVFLAFDEDLRRKTAIKTCKKTRGKPVRRFVQEAQIGSQLEHPNIAPIYDAGKTDDGKIYFAMKYIEGTSFKDILAKVSSGKGMARFEYHLHRRLGIFLKVLEGMAYSHSKAIIHRDLKPENIMIGQYGEVLIVDWGLAKAIDPDLTPTLNSGENIDYSAYENVVATKTVEGAIAGTPGYMSPEQALGEGDKLSPQSDIYTLGIILYEILTLQRPFQAQETMQVLFAIINSDYRPPREMAPEMDIPAPLEAITLKAMAQKPGDRYQTVQEMHDDIQNYIDDLEISVYTPNLAEKFHRFVRRHTTALMVASFVLVLFALFGYFLALENRKKVQQQEEKMAAQKREMRAKEEKMAAEKEKRKALEEARARADQLARARKEKMKIMSQKTEALKKAQELEIADQERIKNRIQALQPYMVAKNFMSGDPTFENFKKVVIPKLKKTLEIDPNFYEARIDLIRCHIYLSRVKKIPGLCMEFFGSLPDNMKKKLSPFAELVFRMRMTQTGLKSVSPGEKKRIDRLLQEVPKDLISISSWKTVTAVIYFQVLKDLEKARETIDELLNTPAGNNWENRFIKVEILKTLFEKGKIKEEKLVRYMDRTLLKYPQNTFLWLQKARHLRKEGTFQEAIKIFHRALECDPSSHLAWLDLGRAYNRYYVKAGNFNKKMASIFGSLSSLHRALALEPRNNQAHDLLSETWGYLRQRTNLTSFAQIYHPRLLNWLYQQAQKKGDPELKKQFGLYATTVIQLPYRKGLLNYLKDKRGLNQSLLHRQARKAKIKYKDRALKWLKEYLSKNPGSHERRVISEWLHELRSYR